MTPSDERQLAHARAVRARGTAMPAEGLPRTEILDSWVRCSRANLDFAAVPRQRIVDAVELSRRRERQGPLRRLALAEIETLFHQIAGSNFLLAFADHEGVILDLVSDHRFQMNEVDAAIVAGSCWSEARCGTNGLGTALETGHAVAVTGMEHFFFKHGGISCVASPIRDSQGRVVGALDASSYVESRQHHTQALVQMAATHVENLLLVDEMRGHLVIAIHPRREFLATLSCGLIAFDAGGRVSAANARAQGLLSGLAMCRGTPFDSLFDATFEPFATSAAVGLDMPLRDALGSALIARCVHAPRLAAVAGMVGAQPAAGVIDAPLATGPIGAPSAYRGASGHAPSVVHVIPTDTPASGKATSVVSAAGTRIGTSTSTRTSAGTDTNAPRMVADDLAVAEALRMAEAAVRLQAPILILGETGTGKELLARHAHESSGRSGAFVAVNCGALPSELFEAELFGYAGGAFTGARREGSRGLIDSADGGTLLLDEVGELPLALQSGLLRFLDDRRVRPVGGTTAHRVDMQVLAATHVDLALEVDARRFRADLFHRLDIVRLALPPLRERSDFAAVARSVLAEVSGAARLDDDALRVLARHPWPGNMRELRAVLTRALLMHTTGRLTATDFDALRAPTCATGGSHSVLQRGALQRVLREFERTGRSVSQTSRNLEVSRTTVYRYLREGATWPR